jgi:hypothetical protein
MSADHWSRQYLIKESAINSIRSELRNIKRSTIVTPDTDASFKNINDILDRLKGV